MQRDRASFKPPFQRSTTSNGTFGDDDTQPTQGNLRSYQTYLRLPSASGMYWNKRLTWRLGTPMNRKGLAGKTQYLRFRDVREGAKDLAQNREVVARGVVVTFKALPARALASSRPNQTATCRYMPSIFSRDPSPSMAQLLRKH